METSAGLEEKYNIGDQKIACAIFARRHLVAIGARSLKAPSAVHHHLLAHRASWRNAEMPKRNGRAPSSYTNAYGRDGAVARAAGADKIISSARKASIASPLALHRAREIKRRRIIRSAAGREGARVARRIARVIMAGSKRNGGGHAGGCGTASKSMSAHTRRRGCAYRHHRGPAIGPACAASRLPRHHRGEAVSAHVRRAACWRIAYAS